MGNPDPGNTGIFATVNGGTTWTAQVSGVPASLSLQGESFISATTGFVVGASGTVLKTTNGGTTWTTQISRTNNDLWGVSFVNATSGRGGTILAS